MSELITCPADDAAQKALRSAICIPTTKYLWEPSNVIEFVPALSDTLFGDGRALLCLTTINSRPAYYVLRIDSSWTIESDREAPIGAPEFVEFVYEICDALDNEFGDGRPDEQDEDPEIRDYGPPWPAFDDRDGCSWERMEWPSLDGESFEPHPYSSQFQLLLSVTDARLPEKT